MGAGWPHEQTSLSEENVKSRELPNKQGLKERINKLLNNQGEGSAGKAEGAV